LRCWYADAAAVDNSRMFEAVERVLLEAVTSGITPGGVLAVHDGAAVATLPFGRSQHASADGAPAGEEVRAETVYDVASLTKPVASLTVFLRLWQAGRIELETQATALVPELTARGGEDIRIVHLLGHAAGLPDYLPFYQRLWAGERAGAASARDALVRMAGETALVDAPGTTTRYSDLGYILLGAALERAGGARLDELARALVFEPLAMAATRFVDLERPHAAAPVAGVAPTEVCPRRGLVWGEVHDENAHAAGGICGHAGLFSTAGDLVRFAAAMNAAVRGERGLFDPERARRLATTPSVPGSTWRLGWETPSREPGVSHAGDRWPKDGVGHLGFTGCSMWLDPPRDRAVVLLTNRVHPTRERGGIRELRRAVMDGVVAALDA
jgi:serine-type D-Ala-D-Ala carboxypeptidase